MSRAWYPFLSRASRSDTGINQVWNLTTRLVAKENTEDSPYLIPNEWICGNLATFLRLPVPPCALMRRNTRSKGMFASLDFSPGDTPPPDLQPDICAQRLPRLSTGVLLFDILIANSDRHSGNLRVDRASAPTELRIFDHDRALFGSFARNGEQRLNQLRQRLGVSGGTMTGGNRHCLLDHITTESHLDHWIGRIGEIPESFIRDVCNEVVGLGITQPLADRAVEFLNYRRLHLAEIIHDNRDEFRSIRDWRLFT